MPVKIFFCYAHEDEALCKGLEKHLRVLKRQGLIEMWYDREIVAGTEWEREIDKHLSTSQIILLLVSPDFMDSEYCYSIEMQRAMERHEKGEAYVIPIILRPVYWRKAPFGKLQALPTDGKAIISSNWYSLDEAFFDVAEGIRKTVEKFLSEEEEVVYQQNESLTTDILPSQTQEINRASKKLLTPQEEKVFQLLRDGFSNKQIASALVISPYTVGLYIRRIMRKLSATNDT